MTYHMQCARRALDFGGRLPVVFEKEPRGLPFPLKLRQIVEDKSNHIIEWTSDGKAIIINETEYEAMIMTKYPGFVKIPTFANLRRQLREYGFDWRLNEVGEMEFFNDNFSSDNPRSVDDIHTKRKTFTVISRRRSIDGPGVPRRRGRPRMSESGPSMPPIESRHVDGGLHTHHCLSDVLCGTKLESISLKPRFPKKLWEVTSDPYPLLVWDADGASFHVNSNKFEVDALHVYPGFVQTSSFLNFRRLMREYGFSWKYRPDQVLDFEFSHPYFHRDHPQFLSNVLTKRKRLRIRPGHQFDIGHGQRRSILRSRQKRKYVKSKIPVTYQYYDGNSDESLFLKTSSVNAALNDDEWLKRDLTQRHLQTPCPEVTSPGDWSGNSTNINTTPKHWKRVKIPVYFWNDDTDYAAHVTEDTVRDSPAVVLDNNNNNYAMNGEGVQQLFAPQENGLF